MSHNAGHIDFAEIYNQEEVTIQFKAGGTECELGPDA